MSGVIASGPEGLEPNEEPTTVARLRIEFDDKALDVSSPSDRLTDMSDLSDSMSLAIATAGGAAGPTLALGVLPEATPTWVIGSLVGAQLVYLAYVVTTIFMRRRRTRSA